MNHVVNTAIPGQHSFAGFNRPRFLLLFSFANCGVRVYESGVFNLLICSHGKYGWPQASDHFYWKTSCNGIRISARITVSVRPSVTGFLPALCPVLLLFLMLRCSRAGDVGFER